MRNQLISNKSSQVETPADMPLMITPELNSAKIQK
jgi:hypothetical protein